MCGVSSTLKSMYVVISLVVHAHFHPLISVCDFSLLYPQSNLHQVSTLTHLLLRRHEEERRNKIRSEGLSTFSSSPSHLAQNNNVNTNTTTDGLLHAEAIQKRDVVCVTDPPASTTKALFPQQVIVHAMQ